MNDEERLSQYMESVDKELQSERLRRMDAENRLGQVSQFGGGNNDPNLAEYQLELDKELDRIFHLLSGHVLKRDGNGNEYWAEPEDDRLKIFSDYGVKQIMNIVSFYINKNTILSLYDREMIMWKVRDFGIELADLIYNRYEEFFSFPSPEVLFARYKSIVREKGYELSDDELYEKCVEWSQDELRKKIRHYPIITLSIIDSVHSTFNRALSGETLKSLRTQTHITENLNSPYQQSSANFKITRPSTWKPA